MGSFRTLLFGDDSTPSAQPIDSGALLREATANKTAGNINGSIELLKRFWVAEPFGSSGYGVEAYLKLPMYLQVAGRRDEAWRTLNVLIADYVLSCPCHKLYLGSRADLRQRLPTPFDASFGCRPSLNKTSKWQQR